MLRSVASLALLALPLSAARAQDTFQHAPDGRTTQHVQNIFIPTVANAPFTATVVAETATIMPDGTRRTGGNRRLVARDSAGRVFQERRFLMPGGTGQQTPLSQLQIDDPNLNERTLCNPQSHTCVVGKMEFSKVREPQPVSAPKEARLPNGVTVQNEDLGRQTLEGVACLGSREVRTFPAKLIGAEHDEPSIKEFWYAPRLGINMLVKRFDPRVAVSQTFTVTHLQQAEPDPHTFAIPAGYKLIRRTE